MGYSKSNLNAGCSDATKALLMLKQSSTMDTTGTESEVPTSYNSMAATATASVSDASTCYNGAPAAAEAV
jgi:hypothetical protein